MSSESPQPSPVSAASSGQAPTVDVVRSGGPGKTVNSARAGYLPISLDRLPRRALAGIDVYLRTRGENGPPDATGETFALYAAKDVDFGEEKRACLREQSVRFVYIKIADHQRFRQQVESAIQEAATDPAIALEERAALVYETSVELMNELLTETNLSEMSPRLDNISRAVTKLVISDKNAFAHLLETSSHDFYTATHMVNVGTWMAPLAVAMGYESTEELNRIVQAGLLHDIGKLKVPEDVLNKPGKLSDEDWAAIRQHPSIGFDHLKAMGIDDPIVLAVTRHHHERLDGTGYPDKITSAEIHPVAKICAVVDSFDAMTAFRPFKSRTMSPSEALRIIESETPAKYDPDIVKAWIKLVGSLDQPFATKPKGAEAPAAGKSSSPSMPIGGAGAALGGEGEGEGRRAYARHPFSCAAKAHILMVRGRMVTEGACTPITTHNVSRSGLGFLCREPYTPGDWLRVHMTRPGADDRLIEGQVMRCRRYNDRWYDVGIRFGNPAAEASARPQAA